LISEVVWPGRKVLFVDGESERLRRTDPLRGPGGSPIGMMFCDGSSRNIARSSVVEGYNGGTGLQWHGSYNSLLSVGMWTRDGVRGFDVK
jgi:hypothetical protein